MFGQCLFPLFYSLVAGMSMWAPCSLCQGETISLTRSELEENLPAYSYIGSFLIDSDDHRKRTFSLVSGWEDNESFTISGDSLLSLRSFNFEKDSLFLIRVKASLAPGQIEEALIRVKILDLNGILDQNGFAGPELAARFPTVAEGDYVILSPTVGIDDLFTGKGLPQIHYPQKIWIRGDKYDNIHLKLDSVSGRSVRERVIIANLEGQVSARKVQLDGGRFWRLTGQYDPLLGIGHADFRGCDREGSTVHFGFSSGTYGWDIANGYTSDETGIMVYGEPQGMEIDHVEISDGGFAGLMMKSEGSTQDMNDVHLHHLYIHDVGGEGLYLGSTNSGPQHQLNRLIVEHCVLLRTGAEALQASRLGPGCILRNNVLWGGMHWMSPFNMYQDHGMQISSWLGGAVIEHNIIIGAGNAFFNVILIPHSSVRPIGDSIWFRNNLGYQCKGPLAAYMSEGIKRVTPVVWQGNYFSGFEYSYDRVYLRRPWAEAAIRVASREISVVFSENVLDHSKSILYERWNGSNAQIVDRGTYQQDVPPPQFRNLAGDKAEVQNWSFYFNQVGEHPHFPAKHTRKGTPIQYRVGDVVAMPVNGETRFFECQQRNASLSPLEDATGPWKALFWVSDGDTTYCPPDDVRLEENSFFAQIGMGLE